MAKHVTTYDKPTGTPIRHADWRLNMACEIRRVREERTRLGFPERETEEEVERIRAAFADGTMR